MSEVLTDPRNAMHHSTPLARVLLLASVALVAFGVACGGKAKPDADVDALRALFACGSVQVAGASAERCRILEEFAAGPVFSAWPTGEPNTWVGRSFQSTVDHDRVDVVPFVLRIKAGELEGGVVRGNGFEGLDLLPFVFQTPTVSVVNQDYYSLLRSTSWPPTDPALIDRLREIGAEDQAWPLAPAGGSVASPTSYWRAGAGGRLLVVGGAPVRWAAELWKVP